MDIDNWKNGELPQAGQTIAYPNSFSDFGADKCVSAATCKRGGVSVVRGAQGARADVRLKTLILPNGKIQFGGNTRFTFNRQKMTAKTPEVAMFNNHGPRARDPTCANNWLLASSLTNPTQAIPCSNDVAIFDHVMPALIFNPSLRTHSVIATAGAQVLSYCSSQHVC